MKKLIWIFFVTLFVVVGYYFYLQDQGSIQNIVRREYGLSIPNDFPIISSNEQWAPNGDGDKIVIWTIPEQYIAKVSSQCAQLNFSDLSRLQSEDFPDNKVFAFIPLSDLNGFYKKKRESDNINDLSYSILIIDLQNHRIIYFIEMS